MKWVRCARPSLVAVSWCALALLASSCGGRKQAPVYPVQGQVSVLGKPATGALVVFHPMGNEDPRAPRPSGYVREDGSFSLTTYTPDDGAPEGEYRVVISWTDPAARPDPASGEVPNRLPARYASPTSSGLSAKVEPGSENRAIFRLGK
jgi:hypothetical protein